ncbi:hypothetical protein QBC46DRAFT_453753 [Diplogelasinospora grovesii]|uniref:DUF4238 domain-containing protein n=1 Tax=Diplogelasinospora grovesii TaxID=303347 RepID=A0AAN6MX25_9PEZI|nr:hypothetical protein QBC46DRAFT_453753 [Diplogelasinospora grovesii]
MATDPQGTRSQFQHFIPQFLLRNYTHKFAPPPTPAQGKKKSKRKYERGKFRGDAVAYNVKLDAETLAIDESPVNTILGKVDMYVDTTKPTTKEQYRIESRFSKMESQASYIFRKIVKSFEAGDPALWLTRDERDLLRKFLFLLKYRNSAFHRRFYHDSFEDYFADDRGHLLDYMRDKGFSRLTDVWFHNLETIMALEMDPEGQWIHDLPNRMYRMDAKWFVAHVQSMYMAICTPANPTDDEFALTDNSYGVFEGPNAFVRDAKTGKVEPAGWANFHEFAPVSPKLLIVLRSFLLPAPLEDQDPKIRELRECWRYNAVDDVHGLDTKSQLEDLPISKALNNYSRIVNGRLELLYGEDGTSRKDHKFLFSFFKIKTKHVNKINSFFFDNSYRCSRIVFGTKTAFFRALEWYMTEPCTTAGKKIYGEDAHLQQKHLEKLAALMKAMGSTRKAVWTEMDPPLIPDYEEARSRLDEFQRIAMKMAAEPSGQEPAHVQTYEDLGGKSIVEDMGQAGRMLQLQLNMDMWSVGVGKEIRARNRRLLLYSYLRLPPARFWSFLKRLRIMLLSDGNQLQPCVGLFWEYTRHDRPEDIFARVRKLIPRSEKLNHLMYSTVLNDVDREKFPELNIWRKPTSLLEFMTFKVLPLANHLLYIPGQIRNCGIAEIEELAERQEELVFRQEMYNRPEFDDPRFDEVDKLELLTRFLVRSKFKKALAGKLDARLLHEFKRIFFEFTFPTPPTLEEV